MQGIVILPGPIGDFAAVRRIGVDSHNESAPDGIAMAERCLGFAGAIHFSVNGIEVQGRLPSRQPRRVFEMLLNRLVAELPEKISLPIPLQARGVNAVEHALE